MYSVPISLLNTAPEVTTVHYLNARVLKHGLYSSGSVVGEERTASCNGQSL